MKDVRVLVVGDYLNGIKVEFAAIAAKKDISDYLPSVVELDPIKKTLDNNEYFIQLRDTSGHEEYDRLRPLVYQNAHVFILLFSKTYPMLDIKNESFERCKNTWIPELYLHQPQVPILVVGLDRSNSLTEMNNQAQQMMDSTQIINELRIFKIWGYVDCRLSYAQDLDRVLEYAIYAANTPSLKFVDIKEWERVRKREEEEKFVEGMRAFLQGFRQDKAILSRLPLEVIVLISIFWGSHLQRSSKNIADLCFLMMDNIDHHRWNTSITRDQKEIKIFRKPTLFQMPLTKKKEKNKDKIKHHCRIS